MTSSSTVGQVRRHVALCPFPFASHPSILLLLSRKIAASAPDVHITFFTTEASAAALSASMPSEGDAVRIQRIDDGLKGKNVAAIHPLEGIRRFMEAAGESLRRSMAAAEEEVGVKISCVVSDAFLSCVCAEIAEEKAVKWLALWTSAAADLASHMYTDKLRSRVAAKGGIEACKDETIDHYIPGVPPVPIKDLAPEVVDADLSSSPVAQMLHIMSHTLPKAAAVAMNSFHTLEPSGVESLNSAFGNIFLNAGLYSLTFSSPAAATKDPEGCLAWLDTHNPAPASVIYIGFGTVHAPPAEEFTALAEALEAIGVPFLWSLPQQFRMFLPEGFVDRTGRSGKGKVVAWAPQMLVLGHVAVGAQLTHCGWNSVTESLVAGVPMICRPLAVADNRFNGQLVVKVWGIGVEVEGGRMTKASVTRSVERLLMDEEGRAIRERIGELKRLAEEAAAEPDGSSIRNLNKFIGIITA